MNYFVESLNEFFDKSDFDCVPILTIDAKDQEIIEILYKNEKRDPNDDDDITSLLETIRKNLEEKAILLIEVELERKLNKYKTENFNEIENHLNFLVIEGNKKICYEDISFERKIENINSKVR